MCMCEGLKNLMVCVCEGLKSLVCVCEGLKRLMVCVLCERERRTDSHAYCVLCCCPVSASVGD